MTKFQQIFLQNWDIKISGKNVQISLQEYLKAILGDLSWFKAT